jgi:hypothetical protein
MKKNNWLTAILFACLLTSCGSETATVEEDSGLSALLELNLQGSSTATKSSPGIAVRSQGTLPGTGTIGEDEGTINRITVGVFKTDGTTDVITETTTLTSDYKLTVNATEGDREIIVVANAPEGYFAGITTKTAFLAKAVSLNVTTPGDLGEADQLTNDLPMSGQATTQSGGTVTTIPLSQGTTVSAYVSLTRLVSRISISKISYSFESGGLYPAAVFTPTEVFLYNAETESTWDVGSTLPTTTVPGQGEASTSTAGGNYKVYLGETVSDFTNGTAFTDPYFFYTFANHDASLPTKLIIKGTFDVNGDGTINTADGDGTVYYPIVINKSQTGTVLTGGTGDATTDRNKTYALTATIKGKGVTSPGEDINPADVSLTVSVAAWAVYITQNVTFE